MPLFGMAWKRPAIKTASLPPDCWVTLAGFCLLMLVSPLLGQLEFLSGYLWLVLLYVLAANVHSVCNQFARTLGYVRLFALDGILRTVLAVAFNILLLAVFPMGITGYMLANVLADGITMAFVFLCAREWQYLRLSSVNRRDTAQMLRYSVPLVPTNLCSWIINISDRYLIALLIGNAATGIYAVANKIPTVLLIVSNIFSSAWQLSALADQPKAEKARFFSNVYSVYSAVALVAASGVILTAQLSTRLLAAPDYFEAWRYVPVLTLATTFACLGTFLSSIYMVEQRSGATMGTTMLGAAANIVGNGLLIPLWGSMGAAISTLFSFLLIFFVRMLHTRSLLRIRWDVPRFLAGVFLLSAQCVLIEEGVPFWYLWSGICFLTVCALNGRLFLGAWKSVLHART